MSKTWKIVIALGIIGLLAAAFMFYKTWYMPQRDVMEEVAVVVDAQNLLSAYEANSTEANALYLDKALEVTGEVSELTKNQQNKPVVSLKTSNPMAGVRCTMKDDVQLTVGQKVTIKGRCTGYMMDVTLIDCYIQK
jgi:hypothetical protein